MQPPNSSIIGRRPHVVARSSPASGEEIAIDADTRVIQSFRASVINQSVHCIGCGYLLRGLHVYSKCPECGAPTFDSLITKPDTLAACDQTTLRLATRGVLFITLGQTLGAAFITALPELLLKLRSTILTSGLATITLAIEMGAALGCACLLTLGAWLVSMPLQIHARTRAESALLCWSLRVSAALLSAVLLLWAVHSLVLAGSAFYFRVFGALITDTVMFYIASLICLVAFNFALRTRLAVVLDVIDRAPLADRLYRIRWRRPIIGALSLTLMLLIGHGWIRIGIIPYDAYVFVTVGITALVMIIQPITHVSSMFEAMCAFKSASRRHPRRLIRS